MSGSDNGDVFQVNRQYFSGGLNLVLGLLTDYLFLETRSAHLILWVFERGAQKYGKLIEVHSARQENEQAIRDARREAENLVQEFERKHYEMLHTLFHDRRMQDARAEKLMNFCESSWHIADNGTLEDKKTVEKRWSNGLERAKAVWEVFKNIKDEVEKRNEELHELYKKFRIVEGSVLRFPNQTYSERDVREVVEVAFSLEVIHQRTEELLRQKQKEETRRRLKLGHADARIDELLKDTVKHKEAVDKDVQKASRKPSGASQSNQTETHVEYKVEIEIASESISRTIKIQDGQPAMFCDVNTERIAYRPQRGLSPTLQAELEICDALNITLKVLVVSGTFANGPFSGQNININLQTPKAEFQGTVNRQGPFRLKVKCKKKRSSKCVPEVLFGICAVCHCQIFTSTQGEVGCPHCRRDANV